MLGVLKYNDPQMRAVCNDLVYDFCMTVPVPLPWPREAVEKAGWQTEILMKARSALSAHMRCMLTLKSIGETLQERV